MQGAPGRAKGPRRVAMALGELVEQRNLMLSFIGGKAAEAPPRAAPAEVDLFGRETAKRVRRRA